MVKRKKGKPEKKKFGPPVVAVLGHVDHGKTSLLDKIRKTDVVSLEEGGVTQKIGAWRVKLEKGDNWITFIDTPGHEAFSKMRARGGKVADMAVLVIAADDSVKPQTVESIKHIIKAKIPFLVAINKIDLAAAKPEKVKKDLVKHDVLVEGMGGDIVCVEVSAKTGQGIKELLEMILLLAQMKDLKYEPEGEFEGVVIESGVDKKRGVMAAVLVKRGTLKIGDEVEVERVKGKIRAMFSEVGKQEKMVGPAVAVEVLGFARVPQIGGVVKKTERIKGKKKKDDEVKKIGGEEKKEEDLMVELMIEKKKKLNLIVKADTAGSLEAVIEGLPEKTEVVFGGVGEISEKDIYLAKTSGAVIVGFRVGVNNSAKRLARVEQVTVKTYGIIYKLFEEMEEVIKILEQPEKMEEILGKAEILADFSNPTHRIAGCKIIEGKIAKSDKIRILRKDKEIGKTGVGSLRKVKESVDRVNKGDEFGIVFSSKVDFQVGDMVISYREKRRKDRIKT